MRHSSAGRSILSEPLPSLTHKELNKPEFRNANAKFSKKQLQGQNNDIINVRTDNRRNEQEKVLEYAVRFADIQTMKILFQEFDLWKNAAVRQDAPANDLAGLVNALFMLKKNLANKIFGYLARCDFWAKWGLRFWILVG